MFDSDGTPFGEFNDGRISDDPLVQLADGRVLISGSSDVLAFEPDGTYLGVFAENRNGIEDAIQLADGHVLVAEYGEGSGPGAGRVSRFSADGTPQGLFAPDAVNPTSILQLADGRVLVGESGAAVISSFSPDGTPLGPFRPGGFSGDMVQLPDGRILVSGIGGAGIPTGSEVSVLDVDGTYLGPFTDGLTDSFGLTLHPDGRVLVVDQWDDTVYAYGVIPVASEPAPDEGRVSEAFPNRAPAGTPAALAVALAEPGTVRVTVLDATGREVSRQDHALGAGEQSVAVETAGLAAGVYAVRVSGPDVEATRPLVVVR